jgi:signal transduction histidine kinase
MVPMSEKSELALRPWVAGEAEMILRSILSSIDTGILVTDLEHVTLACNRRFGEIFGLDIERVVCSGVDDVREMVRARIDDLEGWNRNLEEIYADPEAVHTDQLRLNHPFAVLARTSGPVRDEKGVAFARLWTFRVVTEEFKKEQIGTILHETSLLFDPEPRKIYEMIVERIGAHYGAMTLLSIRQSEFMEFRAVGGPNPLARQIPGNNLSDSFCQFCIKSNGPVIVQNASADPRYSTMLPVRLGLTRYAGVPLMSPDGEIIGTLCILDDRSDEPLGEDDLRFLSLMAMRISTELEREAQLKELQRDLASAQAQLIQSEKLAVTGTLSAAIAHDIRNIVSALTLDLGAVEDVEATTALRTHLDRFNVLAHRLLSYAQPREAHMHPVSVAESLGRVSDLLRQHFRVAGISLETSVEDSLPDITADSARLDHLFVNLSLNAIQAMPRGGALQVRAFTVGDRVVVEIQDNGPGIAAEVLANAFEPFTTTRKGGFGLGLYSCRQIVADCGGELTVSSSPGQGATFRMEFPPV